MIVDVNNLDLASLRCFIFYNALAIAQADIYGIACDLEAYETNLTEASKILFLATHCPENFSETEYCVVRDYIKAIPFNRLYITFSSSDCFADGGTTTVDVTCALTITDNATSCTGGLTINILQ